MSRGRRPPGTGIDVEDAQYFDTATNLRDVASPERQILRDEIEETVHQALRELPNELRTAVTLREFEGLSYEDIAEVMECPVGTVRSRIFRAREAIDQKIKPLLEAS